MSQGNDFANYPLSNADGGASEEVWFVAVAADDIKQMNVDQLDEAFRLGIITSATAVWTEGMDAWAPLGQVADLDADGSNDADGSGSDAAHGRSGSEPEISQTLQSASGGLGGGYGAVTLQSAQNSFLPGPSSVAPVTSSYAPSGSYAPSPFALSTGPVALNVDEDAPPMQRGRRFRPERWALAAAAVIAVGVAAFNNMDVFSSSSAAENTQAPATALAARPYGAEAADHGASPSAAKSGSESDAPAPSKAALPSGSAPIAAPSSSTAASSATANGAAASAKAAAQADEDDAPTSSKAKGGDSLKGSFSKAFNKKASSKATKVKPRKAASRATTKPRATKGKKPGVARSQSAFDPLNDSLP